MPTAIKEVSGPQKINSHSAISRAGASFRSFVPKANAGDESVFIAYLPIRLAWEPTLSWNQTHSKTQWAKAASTYSSVNVCAKLYGLLPWGLGSFSVGAASFLAGFTLPRFKALPIVVTLPSAMSFARLEIRGARS